MGKIRSVLFLTYHFPPEIGGIQTRISKYVEIFSAKGLKPTVFVISNREVRSSEHYSKVDVKYFSGDSKFFLPIIAEAINTLCKKHVDVVHVFTGCSTLLGCSFVCLGRLFRRRTVISFFGSEDFASRALFSRAMRTISLTLADGIATNSAYTMNHLPSKFLQKNQIISGGSDRARSTGLSKKRRTILYVGRLVKRKGVDDLIEAFKIIKERIPDVVLEIVGDGPERRQLMNLADSENLGSYILFRGILTGEDLDQAYERSLIVVLPSKKVEDDFADEGLGLSLIEGSMHGKPLVGTRSGGIPEIIVDGYNGLLVPEADPASLAEAIMKLLEDEQFATDLGRNSLIRAMQAFTWEASAEKLIAIYQRDKKS
ncbi:MAG: glycosyltransferase family 4 protein [Nitrososphaerota archaeon]|jgi:glycosyltransferase involved in cell wall biosynthesis|nr:glycosyltransferase family 4 protein [Nitrososphaerota archaeon]